MEKASEERYLAGVCGLYCGACPVYLGHAEKDPALIEEIPKKFFAAFDITPKYIIDTGCDGCLSSNPMPWCATCEVRKCASDKGTTWCFECVDFPCKRLQALEMEFQRPLIRNLKEMKEKGVGKWLEAVGKRYECPKCGKKLHWYSFGVCSRCGKTPTRAGD